AEFIIADGPRQLANIAGEAIGDHLDEIERRSRDDHDELVSAVTADEIVGTRGPLKERADIAKHAIADQVTERVIHSLEIIEVEQYERDGGAAAQQLLGFREEETAIEYAGELIARCESVQIAHEMIERLLPRYQPSRGDR